MFRISSDVTTSKFSVSGISQVDFSADPNPVRTCGSVPAKTTLSWNVPGTSQVAIRRGSPTGSFVTLSSASGSYAISGSVSDGDRYYLVDPKTKETYGLIRIATTNEGCPNLTALPNPVTVCDGSGTALTTLSWSAPGVNSTEIRIGSVEGTLFTKGGSTGSAKTGKWVKDGLVFLLLDASSKEVLDSVTVRLNSNGCTSETSLTAEPSPIEVCDGSGLGATVMHWSLPPGVAAEIRIGSKTGTLFATVSGSGSKATGKWVKDGTKFYLVRKVDGIELATLAVSVTCGLTDLRGEPNPADVCDGTGLAAMTIYWAVPPGVVGEVRIGSKTGTLFATVSGSGSKMTGKWVKDGLKLYLVNKANGVELDSFIAQVGCAAPATLTASPNSVTTCFTLGKTTLTWSLPPGITAEIRVKSKTGSLFALVSGTGSKETGNWLGGDTTFYLVNRANGAVLATVTVSVNSRVC